MCMSCEALRVNGVLCHELGCPDGKNVRECKECGSEFVTESRNQLFCGESCYCAYNGLEFDGEF